MAAMIVYDRKRASLYAPCGASESRQREQHELDSTEAARMQEQEETSFAPL